MTDRTLAEDPRSSTPNAVPHTGGEAAPDSPSRFGTKILVAVAVALFLAVVIGESWVGLAHIERRTRETTGDSLRIVVETTQELLRAWFGAERDYLEQLALDPALVTLTQRQLDSPRARDALLNSDVTGELRAYFRDWGRSHNDLGFSLIARDFINIFTSHDENMGLPSIIAEQRPDRLELAFAGQTVFVPPLRSEVAESDVAVDRPDARPTTFMAAPVRNGDGRVVAVLTIRFDPAQDFTRLCQLGRMGRTGETYAFDRTGWLLTESRFDEDLARSGLIQEVHDAILSIRISDPGGSLLKGHLPLKPQPEQPLTRMASEAVAGRSGVDVEGYRDYRGERVLGAWVWDEELQIGLATEIDEQEALDVYHTTRTIVVSILGITVLLTLLLMGFVILTGRRNQAVLRRARDKWEHVAEERAAHSHLLLESTPDAMVIVDDQGTIVSVNAETERLLDYRREGLIGQPIELLVPEGYREGHPEKRNGLINDPAHPGIAADRELVARRRDGATIPVEIRLKRLETDEGLLVLAAVRDITERKKAEDALREREERFSSLVENIPGAVYRCVLDDDWTMFYMSDRIEEISGYPASDFIHNSVRAFTSIIHPDDVEKVSAAVDRGRRQSDYFIIEYRIIRSDGVIRWVYEKGKLIRQGEYLDGVIFDITERKDSEEALRKSEERFDLTVRGSGDGLWDHDPATGELWYADRFRELLGYRSEEEYPNVVESWSDGLHPDDRKATLDAFAAHLDRDVPYDVVYRLKTKSGEYRWFRARGISLRDETGRSYRAAGSITDITDQKQAEAALAAAEARSRLLLESTQEGIFGVDTDGVVTFVNAAAARMLAFEREEILGQDVHALVHHSHQDGSSYPVEQCPMYQAFTKGAASTVDDEVLWQKDGASFDVEYTSVPIRQDNAIIGAVVVFRDVTDRKEAQAQLQKLSRAVEQSPSSVVITDVAGHIEYVNPKFTKVTGYTREEALGENPRVLKSGKHPPSFYKDLWRTITAGGEWSGEFCNRKKDGELYWESASISPVRDSEGTVRHYVAVKEDVTERKQAEQALIEARRAAEHATKVKSDFLANMSHEIRTPMNGIIGMTDLALDTDLTPEQFDYLNTVKTSADALLTLINDILDFSKIEAGKLELDPIDFGLRDALADMLNTLANRAHGKGLELAYEVPPSVHDALIGDVHRVRQIVVNLVGNAIKFTQHGEVALSVKQVDRTDENTTLLFSVRDTGIGIPSDKLEAIFRPFEQADASTTRQFGGTGLGLAISVQLVEMMAGRIWAESAVGVGSTFHFTAEFGLGRAAPAPDAQKRRELLEGLPVLVVDDNDTNRRILEQMLRNWRMEPQIAADGATALAALDRAVNAGCPFRLILSDVNMPRMDGFSLFEAARSNPQYEDIPFILLTSAARPGDVARCREIGVAAHLIKPIKQSLLMNAIASAVADEKAVAAEPEGSPEVAGTRAVDRVLKILLAEDHAINQKFAVRAIEKAGHSVVVANNGREAVEAWERAQYDVVLMDLQMPEMDGFEATSRIRKLEQERETGSPTPIIAMTANAMKGDKERCLEAGMDGYVSKPVKRQTLFAEIERVLGF